MVKKFSTVLIVMVLSGLGATPASAARSLTKSFKLSVTLPAAVGLPEKDALLETTTASETTPPQTTEETVVIRNNEKIILRTTVAP